MLALDGVIFVRLRDTPALPLLNYDNFSRQLFMSIINNYYMACFCRRYNARSDWLIVTEL